jgi:ankyrin repeat protein
MTRLQFRIRHLLILIAITAIALQAARLWRGASLDERLVIAAERGNTDLFRLLVWLGADVDRGAGSSGYGPTPLLDAAYRGDLRAVRLFVEHGAFIDYEEKDGFSAITYAAQQSHWDVVEYLYHSGANFRLPDGSGITAVEYALRQDRRDMVATFHAHPTSTRRWRISSKKWVLQEEDGHPCNFRYDVWHRWPTTGREACVKTFLAWVDTSSGGQTVLRGPVKFDFSESGNRLYVTFADGMKRRYEL